MTNQTLLYKTKQFFFVLIKLSIVVCAFYFIYEKLTNNEALQFSDFMNHLMEKRLFSLKNISILIFLSILNWFLEILKWRTLVSPVTNISFRNALEQSLGALTASLFTPNRIGEYGAKAIYYSAPLRKRILLINLISNMSQMAITTVLGIIGLIFFISTYNVPINYGILKFFLLVLVICIIIWMGVKKSNWTVKGFSFERVRIFMLDFPKKQLVLGVLYSLLRYVVFSFQFYILLQLFGIDMGYFNAMILITSMYITASVIPSIFIFDVVIKGSVSLYIFSFIGMNELSILSIITVMWLLNFVLPGMLGSFYVLNFNLPESND